MPTKLNEIDPGAIQWDDEPDLSMVPDEEIQWDSSAGEMTMAPEPSRQYQGGGQVQAQEPEQGFDPEDIWSDASFTGQKPELDEGPSFMQRAIPAFGAAVGGPFATAQLYTATGVEPYRSPTAEPGDWEGMKALTEGYKGLAKSAARGLELITRNDSLVPNSEDYDMEDPIDREKYKWDLMRSEGFNAAGDALGPVFDKVAQLDQLQPDHDYYARLESKPKFKKYMEEVVGMAPQMASQLAAHMIGGPATSGIWMALQIAGAEYDSLIEQGADPNRAMKAAWASALSQAPLEMLSLGLVLRNPLTKRLVKGGVAKFALGRAEGAATEWLTETFQQIPAKFWENWAQDPDFIQKLKEDPKLLKSIVAQGFKEGMSEGNVAAFYGAIFGIGGDKAKKPKIRPKMPPVTSEVLRGISADLKDGTLTADDIETMRKDLDPNHPLYAELGALIEEPAAEASGERLTDLEALAARQWGEEGKGEFYKVTNPKRKSVREVVEITKKIGLEAIVYRGKGKADGVNGLVDTDTGQIYINETATDPYAVVVGHESLHQLKIKHRDLYDQLVEKVKELDIDMTDYLTELNKNRKAADLSELTAEEALATEEYLADFVGSQFKNNDFWQKLNKENPTVGRQLAKIISDLIEKIKAVMRKGKSIDAKAFKQMNDLQDAVASVYEEFTRRESKIEDATKTTEPVAPAKPTVDAMAIENKHRAADMPNTLEYDHIVKGLTDKQKKAAADVLKAYDTPMKERVAALRKAIGQTRTVQPVTPAGALGDLTNEEIEAMSPEQRARAVLGEDASDEEIKTLTDQIRTFQEEEAKKEKEAKPVKKARESKKGQNVRTFRGAVLAAGGIKWGDQFKGERKTMAENNLGAVYLTRQKTGMPWDTLQQQLRDDGWLGAEERLIDVLNNPKILSRGRINEDVLAKKTAHLTAQEREIKKDIEFEAEEPPPGDYQTMTAEDLPVGKKLTIIEDESTRGWDVYEVVDKDPFGVTLKDGVTIELAPGDKVQVRKQDIAASAKKLELTGEKAMGAKQAELRAKRRTQSAGRQQSLGLWEPAPKGDWFQGEKATKKEAAAFIKKASSKGIVHYHSGLSSNINDIKGAIDAGEPLSVVLPRLAKTHIGPITEYAKSGGKVLIDSGAFSAFTRGETIDYKTVVKRYQELIDATDGKVSVIAPDVIGDQAATYDLLKEYADTITSWIDKGVDVILPMQKGEKSPHDFWTSVKDLLQTQNFRVGIPSNKAAFADSDLKELFGAKETPRKVHFLGIGPRSKDYKSKIAIITKANPLVFISTDATTTRGRAGQISKKTDEFQADLVETDFDATEDTTAGEEAIEDDVAYAEGIKKGIKKTIRPKARQRAVSDELIEEGEKVKPAKPEAPVKVHWAEEIKGDRKDAIEYMYRITYEATKQYPTTEPKDLVAVHVWDKPGEGNKILDIRYATRENVDAIEDKARADYPNAWVTLDYDLKAYTPRQGEISYKKYAIERDKGIERPKMTKPAKPEQGRLPGFSVKPYADLDRPEKRAFNRAARTQPGGEAARNRIRKNAGTAWEGVAIESMLGRQALHDLLDGKPATYENVINAPKSHVFKDIIMKQGEEGLWHYVSENGILSKPGKPLLSISGSYAECDPSKNCANTCYAAAGGRRYPSLFIKNESVNYMITTDPARAAELTARQYKVTLDRDVNKALRMFDRGEAGGPQWTKFIEELNKNGVRAQIFSKKPDFIRSVSDVNLTMLSIDSSNTALADANPDLELAVVYQGEQDLEMLDKYENQIRVILPIVINKKPLPKSEIDKIPARFKDKTCPIDAGYKKVGDPKKNIPGWHCSYCDHGSGEPGCFFGKSTDLVFHKIPLRLTDEDIQYRIEDLKKYAKEIPDGNSKKRFNEELDILISEILRGRDPGAASTVQEGLSQIDDGERRGETKAGSKVRKDQRGIKDDDLEVSDTKKVKFSPKFSSKQMGLPFGKKAPATKAAKPKKRKRRIDRIQTRAQTTRMATTGWIGSAGKVARNVDETASLLAHIRKSAQEQIYLVATDKAGLVLEIQRYSKGLTATAPADPTEIIGHTMNIKGAKTLYCAHNHPSRDISPSPEDARMAQYLKNVAELSGIDIKSFVIGGTKYIDLDTHQVEKIKPVARTMKLPVKERYLATEAGFEKLPMINNSKAAFEYMNDVHKNAEGFLFLNSKMKPLGFLPLDKPTTMKAQTTAMLKDAESLNTKAYIFHSTKPIDTTPGRAAFLKNMTSQLGDALQLVEIMEQGVSYADTGQLNKYKLPAQGVQPGLGQLGKKDPLYSPKKAPVWYSQMHKALADKLQGKGTAEQMLQLIDRLAGPPTQITDEISALEIAKRNKPKKVTPEDTARLKTLRKQAGKYKGEFKRDELEWSGIEDYLKDQGHPSLEDYRKFRGWELTKDLDARLTSDQEIQMLKKINAEYDKMVEKPFRINKEHLLSWLRANALNVKEVHYYRSGRQGTMSEGYIDWPFDVGDEYEATWTNPLNQKEHKFEINKITTGSGLEESTTWTMTVDGKPQARKETEKEARESASDWADDLFEESITNASKMDWSEKEGAKVPTWEAWAADPVTDESIKWEIEKQHDSHFGGEHYVIYQEGDLWDDTAGDSLIEAKRFVEQRMEELIREEIDMGGGMAAYDEFDGYPTDPKHDDPMWQLPYGENYQELLFTLPAEASEKRLKLIAELEKKYGGRFGTDFPYDELTAQEQNDITQVSRAAVEDLRNRNVFTHSHWEPANVVAHTRMNDRTDSEGRKTLFIEEIQSDWHQRGRVLGYKNELPPDLEIERINDGYRAVFKDNPAHSLGGIWDTKKEVIENLPITKRVPGAPFKKTWPMLIIKRMVRWAANEGYDAVSWTPGDVQNERYNLEKFVKTINYNPKNEVLFAFDRDGGMPLKEIVPKEEISLHIGKELSAKLLEQPVNEDGEQVLKGKGLKVGGEPMRTFYDRRIRNEVNDFFGKEIWGNPHVEVGHIKIDSNIGEEITSELLNAAAEEADKAKDSMAVTYLRDQAQKVDAGKGYSTALFNPNSWPYTDKPPSHYLDKVRKYEDKYQQIWTLPITPQMREKALTEGMPLFSVKKALGSPEATDLSTKDYSVQFSAKEDHPGNKVAENFNAGKPGIVIRFDGEWDRSAIDLDPLYQFTVYEGPGLGATFVTETLDYQTVADKYFQIVTPFIENKAASMAKKRIDPYTQSYIDALKAAQPDAFITSPDLPEEPDADLDKEIADALEASKGLGRLTMQDKLQGVLKDIWYSSTRHRPYLDPKEYSDVANVLRLQQEVPANSVRRAGQVLTAILSGLKPKQYKAFTHKLLLDDMMRDIESGLLEDTENLPFGFNLKAAKDYLAKLNQIIDADPVIQDAIERRGAFNNKLKRALVDADLLPEAVMDDDRYFHHQVLQYRAVREMGGEYYPGIGVSSKDVRLKKKGWQRGRIGSHKDYNSDYAESEFEVIAQAISQLETKATMQRVQELVDEMPALKSEAKAKNLHQLYVNEAERLTASDKKGRIWKSWEVQEEADPLSPFKAEIAKGLNWIGNLAKKGKLYSSGGKDFTDVIEALDEWQDEVLHEKIMAEEDGRDPNMIPFPFDELGSRAWAYFNHMMDENHEGAPAAGIIFRAIRQRNEFIKEYLGKEFKTAKDLMPEGYTAWVPQPGTSWYKAFSLSDRIVQAVQAGEMVIGQEEAEKIRTILARGKDVEWIIPIDVAKTLDGYDVVYENHMLSTASRKMMTGWKQWILINPYRVVKYNLNNLSGDLDISLAYDPRIVFKYGLRAARDLYKDWKGKKMPPELQAEIDLSYSKGVLGSGWSVQEVGDVTRELSFDEHMQAFTGQKPALIKRGWRSLQGFTNYRENILRLAAFRYFQDRIAAGEKNIYAASNKKEVDGISDPNDKAAKLARELIGDYGNITHSGQWLRRHLIPFYAWMEVNAPRYVRLIRNVKHEGQGAKKIGRALPLVGANVAWRGTKLAMKATAIYVLANLWNRTFFPDEDDELGEAQRRQLHIILGRRDDGSVVSLRFQGALSDALAWFGGEDLHKDIADVIKGKAAFGEKVKEAALAPVIKIIHGVRPDVKAGAELLSGMSYYPDPFNPRPIYDKLEQVTRLFSLNGAYAWLAGKPKRGDTTSERLLNDLMALGFYNSDPGESAYYDIRSKTFDYLDKIGMERPSRTATNKGTALHYYKQALKFGDLKAAEKYLGKYFELGGTRTGITQSIQRVHPLGSLSKKDRRAFLGTLTPEEKERYDLALRWYNETYKKRRKNVPIPPRGGRPALGQPAGESGKTLREVLKLKNE